MLRVEGKDFSARVSKKNPVEGQSFFWQGCEKKIYPREKQGFFGKGAKKNNGEKGSQKGLR